MLADILRDRAAETADDVVFLGGDDAAGFLCGLLDQRAVERLDRVHIDHADGNAFFCHRFARGQRHLHHHARGDDGHVAAGGQLDALVQFKLVAGDLVGDGVHRGAAQTQISRAVVVQQRLDGELHLVTVAGAEDLHTGDDAHECEILDALMRRAVLSDGQTAVRTDDLDVQMRIGDGVAHLLPCAPGGEHGEGVGKGLEAAGGHTGGDAGHVALRDAHVKEPLGVLGRKALGHGRARQIGVENDQLRIFFRQLYERLAVGGAGCDLSCHITCPPVPLILLPARPCPVRTARRWEPCHASRRCFP